MVEDHVVEEPKYNYEIGLWGFYSNVRDDGTSLTSSAAQSEYCTEIVSNQDFCQSERKLSPTISLGYHL